MAREMWEEAVEDEYEASGIFVTGLVPVAPFMIGQPCVTGPSWDCGDQHCAPGTGLAQLGRTLAPSVAALQEWADTMVDEVIAGSDLDNCWTPARSVCAQWGQRADVFWYSARLPHTPPDSEVEIDLAVPVEMLDWHAMRQGITVSRQAWARYDVFVQDALRIALVPFRGQQGVRARHRRSVTFHMIRERNVMFTMLGWSERYATFLYNARTNIDLTSFPRIIDVLEDASDESD